MWLVALIPAADALSQDRRWRAVALVVNGKIKVSNGETVRSGQVLGQAGLSGVTEYPHLHFEVHPADGDRSANPYPALLNSCR